MYGYCRRSEATGEQQTESLGLIPLQQAGNIGRRAPVWIIRIINVRNLLSVSVAHDVGTMLDFSADKVRGSDEQSLDLYVPLVTERGRGLRYVDGRGAMD
jgi:hypothetical protein